MHTQTHTTHTGNRHTRTQVDALLRSGRVQFAGVPIAREASALVKLHRTLSKHFDDLEMQDQVS